jgi:FkbM family methyltransferase
MYGGWCRSGVSPIYAEAVHTVLASRKGSKAPLPSVFFRLFLPPMTTPPIAASYPTPDLYSRAVVHFAAEQWPLCRRLLEELLAECPERTDALQLLAMALLQEGRREAAGGCFRKLLERQGNDLDACFQTGLLAEASGFPEYAESALNRVLAGAPGHLEARYRLGRLLHRRGRRPEAEAAYRHVIAEAPGFAEAYVELGSLLQDGGRWREAEEVLRQAVALRTPSAELHYYLGLCLERNGQFEAADAEFRQALALKPDLPAGFANLARELQGAGRSAEAETLYRRALRFCPDSAEIHNNLALLLAAEGRIGEAEAGYREALRLRPDFAEALHNLSSLVKPLGRIEEAAALNDRALALIPDYPAALNHRGILAMEESRWADAEADFEKVLAIDPQQADAAWNLCLIRLLHGDFEAGWAGYERRWETTLKPQRRWFEQPLWDGRPYPGLTLLVYCEQGVGDSLQFVRYLPEVATLGGRLLLECPPELVRLFRGVAGIGRIIPRGEELPEFDRQCPLLSLPGLLGTRLDSIPAATPYLAAPEEARAAMPRIEAKADAPRKVGLMWAGNPRHANDLNRSIDFSLLTPLFEVPGITWVILQKDRRPFDLGVLAARRGWLDPLGEAKDFADTAAIIEQLDLVIGVDTSLVHLAGALGKPTWVLIPANTDWRWLLEREDSPWYPGLRLFRQPRRLAWPDAIERVAAELAVWAGGRPAAPVLEVPAHPPAVQPAPPRGIQRFAGYQRLVEARHGFFLYNPNDAYVGRALETYGEYGEYEMALLRSLLRPGDTVLEVGANLGALTVPLARTVGPAGQVLAFEPQPAVFHTLCANLAFNALEQARAFPYALGAREGKVGMPRMDYALPNNFGGVGLPETGSVVAGSGWTAPIVRLDGLAEDLVPRLIKIDVEGMEIDVLRGAERVIRRARPLLYVENDRLEHSAGLIRLLRRLGYRLYWHLPPLFNPDNYFDYQGNIYGAVVSVNLLGIPLENPLVVRGIRDVETEYEHPFRGWR